MTRSPDSRAALPPRAFSREILERMEACPDADTLNDRVLAPFMAALETLCAGRGYLINTYGTSGNLAVTGEDEAPVIFDLIEDYLDTLDREEPRQPVKD